MDELNKLGLDQWFLDRADLPDIPGVRLARVISVHRNSFTINTGKLECYAEVTGSLMFNADTTEDYPATGDWVYAQVFEQDGFAVIHGILPRRSVLKRKTAGKKVEFQVIGANIDCALIVQSLDDDYSPRRMERYLAMAVQGRIRPVALLSKSDLLENEGISERISEVSSLMDELQVIAFSNVTGYGLEQVDSLLEPGKTYCLLGSSGVGKTTLLNRLTGQSLRTAEVREKDSKGRHTTTQRNLILCPGGSLVVDTPGMRELGNIAADSGISGTFSEIEELGSDCRFSDCTHTVEEGCAVLEAVRNGTVSQARLASYQKMRRESLRNEESLAEKRRKDKKLGKFYKSVMKHKRETKKY